MARWALYILGWVALLTVGVQPCAASATNFGPTRSVKPRVVAVARPAPRILTVLNATGTTPQPVSRPEFTAHTGAPPAAVQRFDTILGPSSQLLFTRYVAIAAPARPELDHCVTMMYRFPLLI